MSTLRRYDSIQAALRERLPLILPSQRTNLALLVSAACRNSAVRSSFKINTLDGIPSGIVCLIMRHVTGLRINSVEHVPRCGCLRIMPFDLPAIL